MSVGAVRSFQMPDTDQKKLDQAITNAGNLCQSLADAHPNPVNIWNTSDKERADLLTGYLDALKEVCPDPHLMPLHDAGKKPAIERECSLDSRQAEELLHTGNEAIEALKDGARGFILYAGRSDHGTENLVFADHDDLDEFPLDTLPDTLTVRSGSGEGYHETFVNAGDVENAQARGAGEIRAKNWYVVVPGSIHPSDGIYHLTEEEPVVKLKSNRLPEEFRPSTGSYDENEEIDLSEGAADGDFINQLEMSLTEVREYDEGLDELLSTPPRPHNDTQDDSRVDARLVRRLRFHHFEQADIAAIWRQYRGRTKLERDNYVRQTIQKYGTHGDRCRYDGSEQSIALPELSRASSLDRQDASEDDEQALTLDEARKRCQTQINDTLSEGDHTLIDALPAMGKSSGVVRGAERTNTPVTVFTARHDLYGQYGEWCEECGLSYHRLPSFHRDCPTAQGEHGDEWQERVLSLYRSGVMAGEIHKYAERYFDKALPCDDGKECPYKQGWDFEPDEYHVLIGHYQHAYNPNITAGRAAVFDEFPADAFLLEFDGDTVASAVSSYLSENDNHPFEDYTELLEGRDSERGEEARDWFEGRDLERDGEPVLTDESGSANAYAPLLAYAVLVGEDLGNGWEHADLDPEMGVDNHRKAARDRDSGKAHLLLPPMLDDVAGVVALDGTPTPSLWKTTVDTRLNHTRILSDEERADYFTEALGNTIIQTTSAVKTYSSGTYVKPEDDGLLFEAVADHERTEPALISTAKAITQYEQEDVLNPISEYEHYGNLKGSNDFEQEHVGIVTGSQHYGDGYVERWGALAGQSIERGDGKGINLDYGEFGNKVLHHMRENEVLQAVLRFGRDQNDTNVYVHTAALPEWVPIEAEGEINRWSKGTREIIEVLEADAPNEWRTSEIAEEVDITPRQVRTNLDRLVDDGYIEKEKVGRGTSWIVEEGEIDRLEQVTFRSS